MRDRITKLSVGSVFVLVLSACGAVDPRGDYDRAQQEIRAVTGETDVHDPDRPVLTEAELDAVLAAGLTLDEAARLALLNNRRLQASFLGLGVARAEYVQAGLFQNPSASFGFLFPDAVGRVRWTADLVGSVSEIWRIPARQALAQAGLEQRLLDLSRFAGELIAATKAAYYESVAAREATALAHTDVELAGRLLSGVRAQALEGVASKTDESLAEGLALGAEFALQRAEREQVAAVRKLAALLTLERDLLTVELTTPLPTPILSTDEREAFVARSLATRPDLRAATRAVETAEARVALERNRSTPNASVGVSAERPEGGSSADFLIGPAATLELPLFDQNRAQVSRAEFELAQRRKELEALVAEAHQALRAAFDRAEATARAAQFAAGELTPQAERSAALAERAYELGDTTVLAVLRAKAAALDARRAALDSRLDAANARLELERAAGAPLGAAP